MREQVQVGTRVGARYARYITYEKQCMRVANAASSLHILVDEPILSEPKFFSVFTSSYILNLIISILTVIAIYYMSILLPCTLDILDASVRR